MLMKSVSLKLAASKPLRVARVSSPKIMSLPEKDRSAKLIPSDKPRRLLPRLKSTALHLHGMMKCEQGRQGRQGRQGIAACRQGKRGKKVFLILKFIFSNEISSPNYAMPMRHDYLFSLTFQNGKYFTYLDFWCNKS